MCIFFMVVSLMLILYILFINFQLRSINRQLEKRMRRNTRELLHVELFHRELNLLVSQINESLKAEEALRARGLREEKQFRDMIADISHDLRTPLTAAKGYQQLLERSSLEDGQRHMLETALKHTDGLGELIEHFFEYSYLVSACPPVRPEHISLTELTLDALAAAVPQFEEKGLRIDWQGGENVMIYADREMTLRIVQNLIRNSLQHAEEVTQVRLHQAPQPILTFSNPVKDDGSIAIEHIFDRFYSADKARGRASGLGLSIVRLLAEQMNGSAEACLTDGMLEIKVTFPCAGISIDSHSSHSAL